MSIHGVYKEPQVGSDFKVGSRFPFMRTAGPLV